jgi:glutamate formiminotransferase / 5-formyltetrahydrofolate cyclo-ligase
VQISMNLTDYTVTGIPTVFEAIRKEAEDRGVEVLESEVIGLIPLDALCDVARISLKVPGFTSNQVLERRIWD